jgi:hypothetical protein
MRTDAMVLDVKCPLEKYRSNESGVGGEEDRQSEQDDPG